MKKLLLFLTLASAYFTNSHTALNVNFESFDEWQPDPQTELTGFLLKTRQALQSSIALEETTNYKDAWYKITTLLTQNPQEYAETFKSESTENLRICNLKPTTPIHLCFGFDRVAQVTPQAFQEKFTFLTSKDTNAEEFKNLASEIYLGLFNGNFLISPDKQKFLQDLNSDNTEASKKAAEYIRGIARQANYLRVPVMLELAKAYAESQDALINKITEYQQAAESLRLNQETAQNIMQAFLMKGAGIEPGNLDELLAYPLFQLPEEHRTLIEQVAQRLSSWFIAQSDTTQQDSDTEQATGQA